MVSSSTVQYKDSPDLEKQRAAVEVCDRLLKIREARLTSLDLRQGKDPELIQKDRPGFLKSWWKGGRSCNLI